MRLGSWFGGWRSRAGKREDAVADTAPNEDPVPLPAPPQPRPWHDALSHAALPALLLAGEPTLDALYGACEEIGRRHGLGFDAAMDAADAMRCLRRVTGAASVSVVTLPPPLVDGEAHAVARIAMPDAVPVVLALLRAGSATTMVSIEAEGTRTPLGPGPAPDPDAFIAAIAPR